MSIDSAGRFRRRFRQRIGNYAVWLAVLPASALTVALAARLNSAYVDPASYRRIPFGTHSHWAQPWRAYLQTMPAAVFVDGTGINFNVSPQESDIVAAMLAKHGFHHARIEIGWGSFNYDREDQLDDASVKVRLAALRRHGIRPLILLNANSGRPCPTRIVRKNILRNAAQGDRTVVLDSAAGIVPGYSGLSDVGTAAGAARILIISLDRNVATLSQPLPVKLPSGTTVEIATLKYRPFAAPGSPDFGRTLQGWTNYTVNVARLARAELGTTGKPDGGFDLEVWNELTFGTDFLSINNYYVPRPGPNADAPVWSAIVAASAHAAESQPKLFSGVLIGDGFANTIPWPAAGTEPARIDAIDKHPYASRQTFPASEQKGPSVDALFGTGNTFVPTYTALFPEYAATYVQTETIVRDMGPFDSDLYGKLHGRNARTIDGKRAPVTVWITEVNTSPVEDNPRISPDAALELKAKTTARYFTFFLNKGVTQLDLYAAEDHDTGFGIVRDSFIAYANRPNAAYPADDLPYLSPALLVTGRIAAKMNAGLDRRLLRARQLRVTALSAKTNRAVFTGDGTIAHPDLRAVDVFAFLPYQVNAHRFVIPYYIMSRDVMQNWPDDQFAVSIAGFSTGARFSMYDPFRNTTKAVAARTSDGTTRLELGTSDYPRLLIVDEGTL